MIDSMNYLTEYSNHMNDKVAKNPKTAVGGLWEELGNKQLSFLVSKGMKPHHSFLDIGCGVLRGGIHFIKYLDVGNYTGIDISSGAVRYGRTLVKEQGFIYKLPKLMINRNLKFKELYGKKFDYIFAHSVFTHLPTDSIEECLENIGDIMCDGSLFYFTFFYATEIRQVSAYKFRYPLSYFKKLAKENGFKIMDVSSEYLHPRGQWMVEMTL